MAAPNRETVRDALAVLLKAELVDNLAIVQAVYAYKVGDPQGQSPIVAVLGAGSDRTPMTFAGNQAEFLLEVQVWVLYADPDATPPWTEALAEDRLDLIEKDIAEVVEANRDNAANWRTLDYAGRSTVSEVTTIGGTPYLLEKIPILINV